MILDGTGARLTTFAVDTVTVVQGGPEVRLGPLWLRGQLPEDGRRTHQGLCLYQGSEFFSLSGRFREAECLQRSGRLMDILLFLIRNMVE